MIFHQRCSDIGHSTCATKIKHRLVVTAVRFCTLYLRKNTCFALLVCTKWSPKMHGAQTGFHHSHMTRPRDKCTWRPNTMNCHSATDKSQTIRSLPVSRNNPEAGLLCDRNSCWGKRASDQVIEGMVPRWPARSSSAIALCRVCTLLTPCYVHITAGWTGCAQEIACLHWIRTGDHVKLVP